MADKEPSSSNQEQGRKSTAGQRKPMIHHSVHQSKTPVQSSMSRTPNRRSGHFAELGQGHPSPAQPQQGSSLSQTRPTEALRFQHVFNSQDTWPLGAVTSSPASSWTRHTASAYWAVRVFIPVALASGMGPGPLEGKATSAHLNQLGPFGCHSILFKEVSDS